MYPVAVLNQFIKSLTFSSPSYFMSSQITEPTWRDYQMAESRILGKKHKDANRAKHARSDLDQVSYKTHL